MVDVGYGYRLVDPGEARIEGDECYGGSSWYPSDLTKQRSTHSYYRRKIETHACFPVGGIQRVQPVGVSKRMTRVGDKDGAPRVEARPGWMAPGYTECNRSVVVDDMSGGDL